MPAKPNRVPDASPVPQASQEPQAQQPATHHSVEERIRHRAHELYLQRGGHHGSDLEDWLQAEKELREEAAPRSKALSL